MSYILDGEIAHHDTNGGGGVIAEGDTQWMTAGSGILHDELPTERMYRDGGPSHAVQLWVNLPPALKMTPPRYQSITAGRAAAAHLRRRRRARSVSSPATSPASPGRASPTRRSRTPTSTLAPGAQLSVPWNPDVQRDGLRAHRPRHGGAGGATGRGAANSSCSVRATISSSRAADRQAEPLDVLLLGGLPIRAPIAHYGPFVMNTRAEILEAVEDYQAGRLGIIPADQLAPRNFA